MSRLDLEKMADKPVDMDKIPLSFGKYAGRTPEEIANDDPDYLVWVYHNIKGGKLLMSKDLAMYCENKSADEEEDSPTDWRKEVRRY